MAIHNFYIMPFHHMQEIHLETCLCLVLNYLAAIFCLLDFKLPVVRILARIIELSLLQQQLLVMPFAFAYSSCVKQLKNHFDYLPRAVQRLAPFFSYRRLLYLSRQPPLELAELARAFSRVRLT